MGEKEIKLAKMQFKYKVDDELKNGGSAWRGQEKKVCLIVIRLTPFW